MLLIYRTKSKATKKPIELGDAYRVLSDGSVSKIRIVKSSEGSEE